MIRPHLLLPACVLLLLWAAMGSFVGGTLGQLPERVATHFSANGEPNGWMSREAHARLTLTAGFVLPMFLVLLFTLIRSLGGIGLSIPNRAYWLDPARRQATLDYVQRHGFWLACLLVGFFIALHGLTLLANATGSPHLPGGQFGAIIGVFLATIGFWTFQLLRRFTRIP